MTPILKVLNIVKTSYWMMRGSFFFLVHTETNFQYFILNQAKYNYVKSNITSVTHYDIKNISILHISLCTFHSVQEEIIYFAI